VFLRRFLARFFSDSHDIEDVAQEAYLRAYVAEQQKDIEQPKAFLFRIAKNVALTKLTRKSEKITDYIEECGASVVIECGASADSEVEAEESLGLYCDAVAALPDKCRQVFLLRKVHGLAHREIAQRMSLSVSSVEKYLLRGILECEAFVQEREGRAPHRNTIPVARRGHGKGKQ
jgi:RNA polymerase sigma factor (sigma-70 family)